METEKSGVWRKFLKRHWKATTVLAAGAGIAVIWAVLVFLWFVGQAQSTGIVPSTLSLWAMGHLISFILNLAFWELILVGVPVIVGLVVTYGVYMRLPAEEREEYKRAGLFKSNSKNRDRGNIITFVVNVVFIIKIYADGNWNLPFSNWSLDYLIGSYLLALVVVVAIVGVPILIGGSWYLHRELKRVQ